MPVRSTNDGRRSICCTPTRTPSGTQRRPQHNRKREGRTLRRGSDRRRDHRARRPRSCCNPAHRKIAVIDNGHPRNAPAEHSRGYLTRDGENPSELIRHWTHGGARVRCRTHRRRGLPNRCRAHHRTRGRAQTPGHAGTGGNPGSRTCYVTYPACRRVGAGRCCTARTATLTTQVAGLSSSSARTRVSGTTPSASTQRVDDVVLAVGRLDLEDRDRAALQRRGVRMVEGSIERLEYSHDQLQGVRSADELEPATKVIVFPAPRPRDAFLGLETPAWVHGQAVWPTLELARGKRDGLASTVRS